MIDFSNATEATILKMYNNGEIDSYYASWILSKKFAKGYKAISDFLLIDKTITNDIKNLSHTMYKSNVFSRSVKILLTTDFNELNENMIKKLIAISHSIHLVQLINTRENLLGNEIFITYKNGQVDILSKSINKIELPSYELTLFKLILKSENGMKKTLEKLEKETLEQIKNYVSGDKEYMHTENHIDDILSAFD